MERLIPVDLGQPCVLWDKHINASGYGRTWTGLAHRETYARDIGPIPAGYDVDHLCSVRACVNPAHLKAVPPSENRSRQLKAIRPWCRAGHLFDEANTNRKGGYRRCRACNSAAVRRYKARTAIR